MVADLRRHIFQLLGVLPDLVKQTEVGRRKGRLVHLVDEVGDSVALLVAEIDGGKAVQWHVGSLCCGSLNTGELLHRCLAAIGLERCLAPHPVRALFCNRALGQFVAKLNLELTPVQTPFAVSLRDVEFFTFLANLVGDLVGGERRRGKDKLQLVDFFQLCFERFKRVHRKTGGRDLQASTGDYCLL